MLYKYILKYSYVLRNITVYKIVYNTNLCRKSPKKYEIMLHKKKVNVIIDLEVMILWKRCKSG